MLDFFAVGEAGVEGEGSFVEVRDLGRGAFSGSPGIAVVQKVWLLFFSQGGLMGAPMFGRELREVSILEDGIYESLCLVSVGVSGLLGRGCGVIVALFGSNLSRCRSIGLRLGARTEGRDGSGFAWVEIKLHWWRVEGGLVRLAGFGGTGHLVVDLQDAALGAVLVVVGLVLALDDWEGLHDVVRVVAPDAVEVEEGGVQLAAEQEAALGVPAERRAVVAEVAGEGLQVPGGVGEFEDARGDPVAQHRGFVPRGGSAVCVGWEDRELLGYVVG